MSVEMGLDTTREDGGRPERWTIEEAVKAAASVLCIRPGWYQKFGSPATGTDAIRVLADKPPTGEQSTRLRRLGLAIGRITDETDTFGGYLVNIDLVKETPIGGPTEAPSAATRSTERPRMETQGPPGGMLSKSEARAVAERVIGMRSGGHSDKYMFAEPGTVGIIGVCDRRPGRGQVKELERHGLHVTSVEKGPFEKSCSVYITIGTPFEMRESGCGQAGNQDAHPRPGAGTAWRGGDIPMGGSGLPPPGKEKIHRAVFCVLDNGVNLDNASYEAYRPANPDNHGIIVTCASEPTPMIRDRLECIGLVIQSVKKHRFGEKWTVHVEILPHEGRRWLDDVPLPKKWNDIMDRVRKHMDLVHGLFDTYYPSGLDSNGIIVTTTDRPSQSQKHALEADGLIVRSIKKARSRERWDVRIEVVSPDKQEPPRGKLHPSGRKGHEDAIIQIRRIVRLASPFYDVYWPQNANSNGIIVTTKSEPDFMALGHLEKAGLPVRSVKRHRFRKRCTVRIEILHHDEIRAINSPVREKERRPGDVFGRIKQIIRLKNTSFYETYTPANQNSTGIILTCASEPDYEAQQLLEKHGMILRSVTRRRFRRIWTAYVEILSQEERRRRQDEHPEEQRYPDKVFCEIKRILQLDNLSYDMYLPANRNSNGIIVTCNSHPGLTSQSLLEDHGLVIRRVEKYRLREKYTVYIEILSREALGRIKAKHAS